MCTTRSCCVLLVALLIATAACSSNKSDPVPGAGPGGKGDSSYDPPPDAPTDAPVVLDAPPLPDAAVDAGTCVLGTAWPFGDPACTACVQDNCCEQVNACENSQACNDYVHCRFGCILAGQTCIDHCDAMYPDQVAVYDTFTLCVARAPCQSECNP